MKVKWMEHQTRALQFLARKPFAALFMETGTGKTPVGLKWAEQLMEENNAWPGVVFCPNTLTGNWVEEAVKFDTNYRVVRLEGSREQRLKTIDEANWDLLVVNYESARMGKDAQGHAIPSEMLEALLACKFKFVIMDELQKLKDRRASQTKAVRQITARARYRLGLTGTPVIHSPLDLWSEFDVLDPQTSFNHPLEYGSYDAYMKSIAQVIPHPRLGYRAPKIIFRPEQLEEVKRRVARYAFEATKADCLDLPDRLFVPVHLEMEREQAKVYDQLKRNSVAYLDKVQDKQKPQSYDLDAYLATLENEGFNETDAAEIAASMKNRVSAQLVVTLLTRQQQATSGFAKADDDTIHELDSVKLTWLREKLPTMTALEGDHKCVIFCRFTHDIQAVWQACQDLGIGSVFLDGTTSRLAASIVQQFQTDKDVRVFIGQIATASTGLTLTAADYVVFYSNSFAAGDREQAKDRTYRIGQTRKVTYYDLLCTGTVDNYIFKNLEAKKELAELTVKNLKHVLEYGDV